MRPINLIVVHHSASALSTTAKRIAVWHARRFKWGTGYHRVIEGDGGVLDGRRVQRVGAHAKGSNTRSIGICVVGDNTNPARKWTIRQEESLADTLTYFCELYIGAKVCGHRDTIGAATECPGLDVAKWCQDRGIDVPLLLG